MKIALLLMARSVFHSTVVTFFSPSDECGRHGMQREYICFHPSWYGHRWPQRDTVFVVTDEDRPGMEGLLIAWVLLFFSYHDDLSDTTVPCMLIRECQGFCLKKWLCIAFQFC